MPVHIFILNGPVIFEPLQDIDLILTVHQVYLSRGEGFLKFSIIGETPAFTLGKERIFELLHVIVGRSIITNDLTVQHRVTDYKDLSLTGYKTAEETSGTQTLTKAQSAQIMGAKYPILWMNGYGAMRYIEISLDVTYEIPQGKICVGEAQATKAYVGAKEASAVYMGNTKVL